MRTIAFNARKAVLVGVLVLDGAFGRCLVAQEPRADVLPRLYAELVRDSAQVTLERDNGAREVILALGEFPDETKIVGLSLKPTPDEWKKKFPTSSGETWLRGPIRIPELNLVVVTGRHYTDNDYSMSELLTHLEVLPKLDTLSLAFCSVSDELLPLLVKHRLVSLNLASTEITDASGKTLSGMSDLVELNVNDTAITDHFLEAIKPLLKLKSLSVAGTSVTDNAASIVSELESLEVLRLHNTAITDDFVRRLKPLPTLRELDISKTGITDASALLLTKCASLEAIDLNETSVSINAIRQLLDLPRLRRIAIQGCDCNEIDIEKLRADSPWIKIVH